MSDKNTIKYDGLNVTPLQSHKTDFDDNDKITQLVASSLQFYNTLTSVNGRFAHFECEDRLFPYAKPIASENSFMTHYFYNEDGNFILVGEGGIGKTTALLKAWKDLLDSQNLHQYKMIPVYIPLNEVNSSKHENFIEDYIIEYYHFQLSELRYSLCGYRLLLLLDGFNEITISVTGIISELKRLCQYEEIKVVLTSRYDFGPTYRLEGFIPYYIQLLSHDTIRDYLQKYNIIETSIPYDLLATPMMLTLFTNTNLMKRQISNQIRGSLPFHKNETKGELLYNFMLCQTGKTFDIEHMENVYIAYLALFVVSPYIAYVIERQGKFSFAQNQLFGLIRNALASFNKETYNFLFDNDLASLAVFGTLDDNEWQAMPNRIAAFLRNTLAIIQDEGENSSFRHQYFRDYFAASYIILDIRLAIRSNKTPERMMERIIPNYIAEFIGDCLQEYKVRQNPESNGLLECLLDQVRNKKAKDIPLLVGNIVNILSLARNGDLSEVDFNHVDLSHVALNGLCFSHEKHKAVFSGAILAANTFLPQGHIEQVRSAVYSDDGRYILSAGDTTIKEWDVVTGQCIMTFVGHENLVNSAVYSPDGKRILSAANDNTIREWDRVTGQCLYKWQDHKGYVTKAIYFPDGSGILSSSWDGTVLWYKRLPEGSWSPARKVAYHVKNVKSIAVSGDGLYCLTASGDHTVKEWRLEDGSFEREYIGHTDMVNSAIYSPDDSRILTGSYDTTIRIFDRFTCEELFKFENGTWVRNAIYDTEGEAILIASHGDGIVKELKRSQSDLENWNWHTSYLGHRKPVTNVSLNFDGSKVLSASEDGSVREWDRLSSQCIKVFSGNMFSTTDTVYSNDGLLVLTIHGNNFSVARRNEGVALENYYCQSSVTSVDFSPDDRFIISTSADGLFEWNRKNSRKTSYKLMTDGMEFVAEHARYAEKGTKIICLAKNIHYSNQVEIFVFSQGNPEPEWVYTLNVDAVGIEPMKSEPGFLTISRNAIIRKWDIKTGRFLGINGVNVSGCCFSDCCFLDQTIREIITESQVIREDLYLSKVTVENQECLLDGDSLIIYTKDNSKCFLLIDELYEALQMYKEETVSLSGNLTLDAKERFRVLWESDSYIKRKLNPYETLFKNIEWNPSWEDMWKKFLSQNKLYDKMINPHEQRLIRGILSELLCYDGSEFSEQLYYQRGLIFISQIDAGICSLDLQCCLMSSLIETFPNLQFIVSTSAEVIGKGIGADTARELGTKILVINS